MADYQTYRRVVLGLTVGIIAYSLTVFPLALVFGFDGDVWSGICMLYGVVCGAGGVAWAVAR